MPVMICPHERKFQAVGIGRFHETLFQTMLQEQTVIIVVPIKNERIDPMIRGSVYFPCHYFGIGFIRVSPKRNARLIMAFIARLGGFDHFPFRPAFAFVFIIASVTGMIVGEIIINDKC